MKKRKVRATAYAPPEYVSATVRLDVKVTVDGDRPDVEQFLRIADPVFGAPIDWALKRLGSAGWDISDLTLAALGERGGRRHGGEIHIMVESGQPSWMDAEVKKA